MARSTQAQRQYARALLRQAGYHDDVMPETLQRLPFPREGSGSITRWLANMNRQTISKLIQRLRHRR